MSWFSLLNENALAKTVGQISVTANTSVGFNTDISTILGTAALNTAMGGTPSHDSSEDGFSVQIKCNHKSGEKYTVTVNVNLSPFPAKKQMLSSLLSKPGQIPDNGGILVQSPFFFPTEAGK